MADTRDEILKLGSRLLQSRGFSGFSYAHIAEQLSIKTAAIHYHFPAKEDLGIAVVERARARYRRWMDESSDQSMSPRDALEGYFRIMARFADEGLGSCVIGAVLAELGSIPDRMREAARVSSDETLTWLAEVLTAGKKAGVFTFEGPAADEAALIMSATQGALQTARVLGKAHFHAVTRRLRRGIDNAQAAS